MSEAADDSVPGPGKAGARPPVPAGREQGKDPKRRNGLAFQTSRIFEKFSGRFADAAGSKSFSSYGSHAALAVCLFGFAWAAGSYFPGDFSPFAFLKPPPVQMTAAPR